jgi:phenylacetate-CoA ligase
MIDRSLAHARALTDAHLGSSEAELEARLALLRAALAASPFYREVLRQHHLAPGDLRSLTDVVHFPRLDRRTLAERWTDLPALDMPMVDTAELVVVQSSGSTGEPVSVVKDGYDSLHMWAVLRFWADRLGLTLPAHPRVVLVDSLPGGLEYSVRLPILDGGAAHRLSIVRPQALERLRRVRPAVVFSDPAGLHWLAASTAVPRPLLLLSSAQHLATSERRRFSDSLGAPILNYYATTETGPIAWECLAKAGIFHVLVPDVYVESVEGELCITRLRPSVLPLLRYRTGDRGEVINEACACGRRGPSIVRFSGRRACFFVAPDGRRIDAWQLAWIFKLQPLASFRLTQVEVNRLTLELSGGAVSDHNALVQRLHEALRRLGWSDAILEVAPLSDGAVTKPEPFRCEVAG